MAELIGTALSGGFTVYQLEWDEVRQAVRWVGEFINTLFTQAGRYAVLGGVR